MERYINLIVNFPWNTGISEARLLAISHPPLSRNTQEDLRSHVKHEVRHWLSVVWIVSNGMGIALVPRALTDSGIASVRFLPIPHARFGSDVYCIGNERQMPSVLPALLEALRA